MLATLDDLVPGQILLVRVDLNSPLEDGVVQDNLRFDRHAQTLRELAAADHRVVVLSHQGRPGQESFVSLRGHAPLLANYLDREVTFCPDTAGEQAREAIQALDHGEILLLENVRMHDAELADRTPDEHARSSFVQSLASMGDAYVGDAYSTAHRPHASIVGLPMAMDDVVAGRVMEAEFTANSAIQSRSFEGDVVMVLGGTKADDLIRVIDGVTETVDRFLLGGVLGELFLRAEGYDLGYDVESTPLYDDIWDDHEEDIRRIKARYGDRLETPSDLAFADAAGDRTETPIEGSTKTVPYLDIGSETAVRFAERINDAGAVFVKGAVGVFEDERFSHGTVEILNAIGDSAAFSVIGGGDTARAIDLYELDRDRYDHVSIAGGAYVRALAGDTLPGVDALQR